jgi:hypothetical protein
MLVFRMNLKRRKQRKGKKNLLEGEVDLKWRMKKKVNQLKIAKKNKHEN